MFSKFYRIEHGLFWGGDILPAPFGGPGIEFMLRHAKQVLHHGASPSFLLLEPSLVILFGHHN